MGSLRDFIPAGDGPLIAHTSDWHLGRKMAKASQDGVNIRELDVYRAAEVLVDGIVETIKPDVLVHGGDLWDRVDAQPRALRAAFGIADKLREAQIPVVSAAGNHDTLTQIGAQTNLWHMRDHFDWHMALEQQVFEVAGLRFHCLPYRTLSNGETEPVTPSRDPGDILVCHAAYVADVLPDFVKYDHTQLDGATLSDPNFDLRLLGHIHVHQQFASNAFYSGAPERLSWGEAHNTPSIHLHRVHPDGTVTTVSVPLEAFGVDGVPRPMRLLDIKPEEGTDVDAKQLIDQAVAEIDFRDDLEGALVRVYLHDAPRDLYHHSFDDLLKLRASHKGALACDIKAHLQPVVDPTIVDPAQTAEDRPAPTPGLALTESFRQFVTARGDEDLAELGAKLIAHVTGEEVA